jgi:N4-gp56 family major capsid protein
MAITAFGTNDAQTVKIWSSLTIREALKATLFSRLMGTGKSAVLQKMTELEKGAGDLIKYDLLMQMTGDGVTGDNRMRDSEEALVYEQDTVGIDQLRNAHAFRRMSQQRTLHNLRSDAKSNLADWFSGTFDSYMFRTLCGDTTMTHGGITATAPTSEHTLWSGDATAEGNVGSNDQFSLADIDYAIEMAKTLTPPIRPTSAAGEQMYVMVLNPYSVTDLRLDVAASAYFTWPDIQMYANKRGLKNPIFTGALGIYNNVVLIEANRLFSPASGVYNNLFLGAQAGVFAMGGAYDSIEKQRVGKDNLMSWFEMTDDYGNEKGISVGSVFGMNKSVFNSKDYGLITVQSYGVAHA